MVSLDWCAGFFEGEGNATLHKDSRHKKIYLSLHLQVAQVHREPLDAFCQTVQAGSVNGPYGPYQTNRQPYYQWSITGLEAIPIAEKLIPLMFHKGEQVQTTLTAYQEYLND